ncbi:MFS transporter [Chromobacterium sp. ATCC 53434]|uniref:MFS transporter n=1 Tax=Chromobacterium sp. (strain ATCC 53434 / SC 14030) TaxID=2059672 RepID=UPI0013054103|nr:MFS transporter [Chromobacterium sp. ATCC 53434]
MRRLLANAAPSETDASRADRSLYIALAAMYIAQGLPIGFAFNAMGTLIRESGHDLAMVGMTGLAFLPWALKFLWAGAVDNACRRWGMARVALALQALIVAGFLGLAPLSLRTQLGVALAALVWLNLLCATQDIVTNACAVTRLQGRRAGAANAIQVAGFLLGMLAGGGGVLLLYARFGWMTAMALLAGAMATVFLLLAGNRGWAVDAGQAAPAGRARLRDSWKRADFAWAVLLALSFKTASSALPALLQPWLLDHGFGVARIGTLQLSNMLATAVGALLLGMPLVRRLGSRRAVGAGLALAALGQGGASLLSGWPGFPAWAAFALFGAQSLLEGAMYVTIWSLFMNWASPSRPGTDYTAMQCCESLGSTLAIAAVAPLAGLLGYGYVFAGIWALSWLLLGVAALCLPRLRLCAD